MSVCSVCGITMDPWVLHFMWQQQKSGHFRSIDFIGSRLVSSDQSDLSKWNLRKFSNKLTLQQSLRWPVSVLCVSVSLRYAPLQETLLIASDRIFSVSRLQEVPCVCCYDADGGDLWGGGVSGFVLQPQENPQVVVHTLDWSRRGVCQWEVRASCLSIITDYYEELVTSAVI